MMAVQERLFGISKAEMDHDIPKTTLKGWLSINVKHGVNPRSKPYLDNNEENELASFKR